MISSRQKGLFLDRDGVINVDTNYVYKIEDFTFIPGIFPFLRAVIDKGYKLAVVTNQSGVGRGLFSAEDFEKLTNHMQTCLRREGIEIPLVLSSFAHPTEGQGVWRRGSFWRKPAPGMILEAAQRLSLDLSGSALLGDSLSDMQAARAAGLARALWLTEAAVPEESEGITPVRDFSQALSYL